MIKGRWLLFLKMKESIILVSAPKRTYYIELNNGTYQ